MTLDEAVGEMTTAAINKAMEACVTNLHRLKWDAATIKPHLPELTKRLRAACDAVVEEAIADFSEAMRAGTRQGAVTCFYIPFIAAGIKVASEFDQDQADDFWADYARQSAVE